MGEGINTVEEISSEEMKKKIRQFTLSEFRVDRLRNCENLEMRMTEGGTSGLHLSMRVARMGPGHS